MNRTEQKNLAFEYINKHHDYMNPLFMGHDERNNSAPLLKYIKENTSIESDFNVYRVLYPLANDNKITKTDNLLNTFFKNTDEIEKLKAELEERLKTNDYDIYCTYCKTADPSYYNNKNILNFYLCSICYYSYKHKNKTIKASLEKIIEIDKFNKESIEKIQDDYNCAFYQVYNVYSKLDKKYSNLCKLDKKYSKLCVESD